jgi:N-acylneuraminate cytidylyltransferase
MVMSLLALIPARGDSKEIPRKNIKEFCGKPLIAWAIEAAQKASGIDRIVLSTEDHEIAEVAQKWGAEVPFMRPAELAGDDTPGIEPVLHALEQLPTFDEVLLLQPTSPLRTAEDIG